MGDLFAFSLTEFYGKHKFDAYPVGKKCIRKFEKGLDSLLLLKGPIPETFSFILGLFKQTILFLQQINVKNVHQVYSAGI